MFEKQPVRWYLDDRSSIIQYSYEKAMKHSKTRVDNMACHLIWCPKYRHKVLVGEIEKRLKELLLEKTKQLEPKD